MFPSALFTILGFVWCYAWRFDPVLMIIALCLTAFAASWFVVTIVEVAKTLDVTPERASTSPAPGEAG
jgi:hypothetical protein